jgi:hypothetical protein
MQINRRWTMDKQALTTLLEELAIDDLAEGADLRDHPCSVAIRALDQCFDDLNYMKLLVRGVQNKRSKKARTMIVNTYDPSW